MIYKKTMFNIENNVKKDKSRECFADKVHKQKSEVKTSLLLFKGGRWGSNPRP